MNSQRSEDSFSEDSFSEDSFSEGSFSADRLLAFLAGLALGALVGAAAMLLLAPRAGKQTRSQIQKQGAKLRQHAVESMDEVVTEAGDKANQFTDSVQKQARELQQQAQELLREGRK